MIFQNIRFYTKYRYQINITGGGTFFKNSGRFIKAFLYSFTSFIDGNNNFDSEETELKASINLENLVNISMRYHSQQRNLSLKDMEY